LILDRRDSEVCVEDPMLEVDLVVTADAAALARVWMGALTFADAMSSVDLRLEGRPPGCGNPYLRFVFSV
jgi:hypothetical protein